LCVKSVLGVIKKLDLLVVKSYVGPLVATFFISVFLLLMQFLWKYIDDLVGKGLEWNVIAELMLYASAGLVPMALPLSILLASIMVFGNLGEHNELMAMKSAGIPLQRIMLPIFLFNLMVGGGAYLFSNHILPYTNLKMGALLYDVRQQRPELSIKEGAFYKGIDGISIKIKEKDPQTAMMYGLMIYDHRKRDGNLNVTVADSGTMIMSGDKRYLILTLYEGGRYQEVRDASSYQKNKKRLPAQKERFREERIMFQLEGLDFKRTSTEMFKDNYQMLNSSQLSFAIDSLERRLLAKQRKYFENANVDRLYRHLKRGEDVNVPYLNVDSVFSTSALSTQKSIMREALTGARNTESFFLNVGREYANRSRWINKHKIEWHRKLTIAAACVVLFFIGAPFGAIVRKGGLGMPVVISVFFFIIYYVVTMAGEKAVKTGEAAEFQGMWFASMILIPLGTFLTYQATHDRVILNISSVFSDVKNLFLNVYQRFKK
jgi:lipopolysaccharide export system permease protein